MFASGGFDALRDELGSSRESSIPCGVISLDVSYEEQDLIKVSQPILRLFCLIFLCSLWK